MEKFRKKNFNICAEQADALSVWLGVDFAVASALAAKGITKDSLCGEDVVHDPFLMAGMRDAVDCIEKVANTNGKILIFGDYDADGLTAASILSLFFSANGIQNDIVIPTREMGYGICLPLIESKLKINDYSLVLTVDCGISNRDEVEFLQNNYGIEVIVTDHHELPPQLPNCICVNPKISYPFKYLSGAGVAFKLVQALSDLDTALKFADLAAVGTIGDVMPLTDENRTIVIRGLANAQHRGLKKLAEVCSVKTDRWTCADISLRICPKINAAGRIGNPGAALELLLSDKRAGIDIANELLKCNTERADLTEKLNCEIRLMLRDKAPSNCVVVKNAGWHIGIIGIAANKLAETYSLPVAVLTGDGNKWMGSARSRGDVNLYELFSKLSDTVLRFGGHSGAVGFSVMDDKLESFEKAFAFHCGSLNVSDAQIQTYDVEFSSEYNSLQFLDKLSSAGPLHISDNLVFHCKSGVKLASLFGGGQHLNFVLDNGLVCKAFSNFSGFYGAMKNNAECEVLFTLEIDSYTKTPVALVKALNILNSVKLEELYCVNYLQNYSPKSNQETICRKTLEEMIEKGNCLIVCNTYAEFEYLKGELKSVAEFPVDMFVLDFCSGNRIIISPNKGETERFFGNVVTICSYGLGMSAVFKSVNCPIVSNADFLYSSAVNREGVAEVYRVIRNDDKALSFKDLFDRMLPDNVNYAQFLRVVRVLEQLAILEVAGAEKIAIKRGTTAELTSSQLYLKYNTEKAG